MKVYVTKHALTSGIEELIVEDCGDGIVKTPGLMSNGGGRYFHGKGKDWHEQEWQAKIRAEQMKEKKIKTLTKQIEKLEKMRF